MPQHRAAAKFFGRFDGDDRVSECCEARRIASGTRADIENPAGSGRDQVHDQTMGNGKTDALVALEQLRRLLGIVLGAADPDRSHRRASYSRLSTIVEGGGGIAGHRRYRFPCFVAAAPNHEPTRSQAASSSSSQLAGGG